MKIFILFMIYFLSSVYTHGIFNIDIDKELKPTVYTYENPLDYIKEPYPYLNRTQRHEADSIDSCYTVPLSVSNITNCDDLGCEASFSALLNVMYMEKTHSCIVFSTDLSDNYTHQEVRVDIALTKGGWNVDTKLLYTTGETQISYNTWCDSSAKPGAWDKCKSEEQCADLPPPPGSNAYTCKKSQVVDPHWYVANPSTSMCNRLGFRIDQRFKVLLIGDAPLEFHYLTSVDKRDIQAFIWSGLGSPVLRSQNITITLIDHTTPPQPKLGKYAIFDRAVPYDLYFVDDINSPGQYDPSKVGYFQVLPTGVGLKYNTDLLRNYVSAKLIDCKNDRASLSFSGISVATMLENMRIINDSLRSRHPESVFYDQNAYFLNDVHAKLAGESSHLHDLVDYTTETTALGGFASYSGYYLRSYNCDNPEGTGGFFTKQAGVMYIGTDPTDILPIPNGIEYTMQYRFCNADKDVNNLTVGFILIQDVGVAFRTVGDLVSPCYWGFNNSVAFTPNETYSYRYIFQNGECKTLDFDNAESVYLSQLKGHSLFIPFPRGTQTKLLVQGKFPNVKFFSKKVCPDVKPTCKSNDTYITMVARSTCGAGDVVTTSSESDVITTGVISVGNSFSEIYIPRHINTTGNATIGLCYKTSCSYCSVAYLYQKTPDFVEYDKDQYSDVTKPSEDNYHWNPFNDANWSVKSELSTWEKVLKYLYLILYWAIIILIIYIGIKLLWIIYCFLRKRFSFKFPSFNFYKKKTMSGKETFEEMLERKKNK